MRGRSMLPGSWVVFRLLLRGHPRAGRTSGIVRYIGRISGRHSEQIQAHRRVVVVAEVEEGSEERVEAGFALRTETVGMGWEAIVLELQVVEYWLSAAEPVLCVLPGAFVVVAASTVYAGPPTTCASRRRPLTVTV